MTQRHAPLETNTRRCWCSLRFELIRHQAPSSSIRLALRTEACSPTASRRMKVYGEQLQARGKKRCSGKRPTSHPHLCCCNHLRLQRRTNHTTTSQVGLLFRHPAKDMAANRSKPPERVPVGAVGKGGTETAQTRGTVWREEQLNFGQGAWPLSDARRLQSETGLYCRARTTPLQTRAVQPLFFI